MRCRSEPLSGSHMNLSISLVHIITFPWLKFPSGPNFPTGNYAVSISLLCSREAWVDAISDAHTQGPHMICHHTVGHIHVPNIRIPNQTLVSGPPTALKEKVRRPQISRREKLQKEKFQCNRQPATLDIMLVNYSVNLRQID